MRRNAPLQIIMLLAAVVSAESALGQWIISPRGGASFQGVALIDAFDGALIDDEWIDLTGNYSFSHAAIQVGQQVWISEVGCNCIRRYEIDFEQNPPQASFVDTIGTGILDNPRGMALANSLVYVANSFFTGIVVFDANGTFVQQAEQFNINPVDIEVYRNGLLVSDAQANEIRFYDFDLNQLGVFHDPPSGNGIALPQQIKRKGSSFEVLGAGFGGQFSVQGLYIYDGDGNEMSHHLIGQIRGVHLLGDGNILVSDNRLSVFNTTTFTRKQIANIPVNQFEPLNVFKPGCGNGLLEPGEICDDGNTFDLDGCDSNCMPGALCGNGILEPGEQCDDGNLQDGDGCDQDCTTNFVCGNGILEPGEDCDDGNLLNGDGCDSACAIEATCGNAVLEPGEQCDSTPDCAFDCTLLAVCGDGKLQPGEMCDDANNTPGDGCDADCRVEPVNPGTCIKFESSRLISPNPEDNGVFGIALEMQGNRIVIGAIEETANLVDAGVAYLYEFGPSGWQLVDELRPSNPEQFGNFGDAIGLDGDVAAIGSILADTALGENLGAVFVYRRDAGGQWNEEATLALSAEDIELQENPIFPSVTEGVAVSGDTIVVGGEGYSPGGIFGPLPFSGAAWVFRFVDGLWTQEARLIAPDATAHSRFATSVDIDGDVAVFGAPRDDTEAVDSGAAYIYRRTGSTWTQERKLTVPGINSNADFGRSVGISGDTVVIGASQWSPNDGFVGPGAAFVYRRIGMAWVLEATLIGSDNPIGRNFGWALDIDGDTIAVGAELEDDFGTETGAAYIFTRIGNVWVETAKIYHQNSFIGDRLGRAVAVDEDHVAIGAQFLDTLAAGGNEGGVFMYELGDILGPDCNGNGAPDLCDIALGVSADSDADGIPDECSVLLPGDIDGDGNVDLDDRELFVGVLLETNTDPDHVARSDLNGDGFVNGHDIPLMLAALMNN